MTVSGSQGNTGTAMNTTDGEFEQTFVEGNAGSHVLLLTPQ